MDDFRGKTHCYISVSLAILICHYYHLDYIYRIPVWTGLIVGSILPDADNMYAPMGKIFPLWLFIEHRTWTHSLWIFVSVIPLVVMDCRYCALGLGFGLLSHLLADTLTMMGVPFLYPFKKHRYSLSLFTVKQHDKMVQQFTLLTIIYQVLR